MTGPASTHLHVHSHYTLLGGTASVRELAARAAADGLTHLALTDTNALYGAVAFDQACRQAGVQSLLGMAVTVAPPQDWIEPWSSPGLLLLLATGPAGYRSLCRLSSSIQGQPERASLAAAGLSLEALATHSKGLLCLSGGRQGWAERSLRAGNKDAAERFVDRLADIYGDHAYLSVELHQPGDRAIARKLIALGQRAGLESVAAQPIYGLSPGEVSRLPLLAAIDRNISIDQVPPSALPAEGNPNVDLHWLSQEELAERFADLPELLQAVENLIGRCGTALPDGRPIWPNLPLPAGQEPDQALEAAALRGLEAKYPAGIGPALRERLRTELDAIAKHGYSPLFLIVADIVRFARETQVPVNTRGSVANSLVAYCAGITNVDPMAHGLLFERFLNPARADLPDIDVDFCSRRRDQVLDYVRRTYGPEHVALVSTVSTLQPRGAVRETAKAFGISQEETKRLVALLPRRWHPDPRRRDKRTVDDVLDQLQKPRLRNVIESAYELIGQPHHLSVHPGGLVITPGPLTDTVPLQWAPKGFLITQFARKEMEAIGLPKLDLLGIRALSVLADAERLVQSHHDSAFTLEDIPTDDKTTGDVLSQGATIGVFQCESQGARRTLRQLKARSVKDLAVANAFFKPGPAMGGMARTFVRRYRGEEPVTYLHPALTPILESTQGVLIFQEQILRVAREIAGMSWAQADQLRRGMSHFGHREMAEMQAQFLAGCQQPPPTGPGLTPHQAQTLWEQVLAFAGYGFNQGHATSYAVVSYRSAYLKTHWTAAFLCARLAEWGGFHHPAIYQAEALRLGLVVRPPHVNHSGPRFTLGWEGEQGVLWMGLGQVRDLRRSSVKNIVENRQQQAFADLRDLLSRIPLQHKETRHLIQCGALDGLAENRAALLLEAKAIQQAGSALQMTFAFARAEAGKEDAAQRLRWEREVLGQPVSVHPLEILDSPLPECLPLNELAEVPGRQVTVAGVRLPGWTGGQGFYLGDGQTFILARGDPEARSPEPWQPLLLQGRWVSDEWNPGRLQIESLRPIPVIAVD